SRSAAFAMLTAPWLCACHHAIIGAQTPQTPTVILTGGRTYRFLFEKLPCGHPFGAVRSPRAIAWS
ncbi:hypothetical protein U6W33_12175, partial [Cutibacterium acnes]